jgi:Uma2 family endonuclease
VSTFRDVVLDEVFPSSTPSSTALGTSSLEAVQSVVVLGPPPAELEELIERRHRLGLDLYDEVWEGTYHMAPAPRFDHANLAIALVRVLLPLTDRAGLVGGTPFNLGGPDNYRVPDLGWLRHPVHAVYVPTAALVVEVVSPDDETYDKLPFYAAHGVDEVMVVEGQERSVRIFSLAKGSYQETGHSDLLGVGAVDLVAAVQWPA